MFIKTICPYCGVGCSLNLIVKNNRIEGIKPDKEDEVSEGRPCIKGLTSYQSIYSKDRIRKPMIRKKGKLEETTWEEAYQYIHKKIKNLKENEIGFYASSPAANEDAYILQRFARETFKTENLDSCARLCHATSVYALRESFGVGGMTTRYDHCREADCILIIGTNPKITYPVVFNKITEAKKRGATIICVNEYITETAEESDIHVSIKPGTESMLLNAILRGVITKNKTRLTKRLEETIKRYTKPRAAEVCGIDLQRLEWIIEKVAESKKFILMYGMGMTQHSNGAANVFSSINLTIAKQGEIMPMRGKANIQGVTDMGFEPRKRGETISSYIFHKPVKALYIMESNPAQSLPELNRAHKIMRKIFIITQTTFPNLTMEYANVVLPSCAWAEREGTFTNAESRIRHLNKAAEPAYGKANWEIIKELARHFGRNYEYHEASDITRDIIKNIEEYKKIDISKLKIGKNQFVERRVKYEKYHPATYEGIEEPTSKKYPYILTTERYKHQFCTSEMSKRTKLNELDPEAYCLISKEDSIKLNIKDSEEIMLESRVGKIKIKSKISYKLQNGLLVAPFHYRNTLINKLVPLDYGPIVEEPNLKKIAVNIKHCSTRFLRAQKKNLRK